MSLRTRLERLERDQPDPDNGMPSANFFDLLPAVYVLGTVDLADLSPTDAMWIKRFRNVFVNEGAPNQECGPADVS